MRQPELPPDAHFEFQVETGKHAGNQRERVNPTINTWSCIVGYDIRKGFVCPVREQHKGFAGPGMSG
jgi:hypothetical protein